MLRKETHAGRLATSQKLSILLKGEGVFLTWAKEPISSRVMQLATWRALVKSFPLETNDNRELF